MSAPAACTQTGSGASFSRTFKQVSTTITDLTGATAPVSAGEFGLFYVTVGITTVHYMVIHTQNSSSSSEETAFYGDDSKARLYVASSKAGAIRIKFPDTSSSVGLCYLPTTTSTSKVKVLGPYWVGLSPTLLDGTAITKDNYSTYFAAGTSYSLVMESISASTSTTTTATTTSTGTGKKKSYTMWIIIGVVVAVLVLIIIGVVVFLVMRKKPAAPAMMPYGQQYA